MEPSEQWIRTQPCPEQHKVEPCEQLLRMPTNERRQPVIVNPNPPLLVPIIPTHPQGCQQIRKEPCDSNRQETIATTWIPVQTQQHSCLPVQDSKKLQASNLQYSQPRTKSINVQNW